MICADVRERILDHVYGLLEGDERSLIEAHLRDCASCAADRAKASEQRALLRLEPPAAVPPGLAERTLRRVERPRRFPLRGLAAAAGLLLAAALVWSVSRERGFVWDSEGARRAPMEGELLSAEGVLEYPDGTRISLQPGARLRADGRRSAFLEEGEVFCRVRPSDERFVVSTPLADIVVLGTDFTLSLRRDVPMNRSKALASGLVLTVAVASGVVLVGNGSGEVTLRAEEAAAVVPGQAPAKIAEEDPRKVFAQAKDVDGEADALAAEAEELRRSGRLLLAERQRRALTPEPAPKKEDKEISDLIRAQMKVMMKGKVKEAVDKLDRIVALSPEQRRSAESLHEKAFERILEALVRGDYGALDDRGLEKEIQDGVSRLLRPDQRPLYDKARQEEEDAARVRRQEEERKGFHEAAEAMGLAPAERSSLEPLLAAPLQRFREEDAKLQVKALTGGMSLDALKTSQAELRAKLLGEMKERLAPDTLDALRRHLEKLSKFMLPEDEK
jgi:hypothetical protein